MYVSHVFMINGKYWLFALYIIFVGAIQRSIVALYFDLMTKIMLELSGTFYT